MSAPPLTTQEPATHSFPASHIHFCRGPCGWTADSRPFPAFSASAGGAQKGLQDARWGGGRRRAFWQKLLAQESCPPEGGPVAGAAGGQGAGIKASLESN